MSYINKEKTLEEVNRLKPAGVFSETIKTAVIKIIEKQPDADAVAIPEKGIGEISDGYHTFNELYHHRAILFSVICNSNPQIAWKSKLHDTGDMFDGMFIVGIETPQGQATYHYDIEPYWDLFKVKELPNAPKWDGHTPEQAIERILSIVVDVDELQAEIERLNGLLTEWKEAAYKYADSIESIKAEAVKDFSKFLIDRSEGGMISISYLPDLMLEWQRSKCDIRKNIESYEDCGFCEKAGDRNE